MEINQNNNYEICVIGSGPAGSVITKFLLEKGHKVLMIEFGGNENKQSNLFGINSIINNGHTENLGRSFQYGGTSNKWSGRIVFPDEIDFDNRESFYKSYWPLKYSELFFILKKH